MKELADLTAPAAIARKPLLEAEVQKQCVTWARARGYWARKFSSMTQNSVPDYLFGQRIFSDRNDHPNGPLEHDDVKFATEFKREGAKIRKDSGCMSTPAQVDEQKAMRDAGWHVWECSDFDKFKAEVLRYENYVATL